MKVTFTSIILGAAWAPVALALALPTEDAGLFNVLNSRALSPDNTCGNLFNGNNKNYTCDPTSPQGGPCCSQYGYCGSTEGYCGTGCQNTFGKCTGSEVIPVDPNRCGPANGNNKCLSGLCCSQAGYCGNTTDYCGAGCQTGFGDCSATTGPAGDGTCGPAFGNKKCPSGQCCSAAGYCGTTKEYCTDPDCQWPFGTCDSSQTPAGASTLTDPRPLLGSLTYDNDIYDCTKANVVALTYDDGPYQYTNQLLDTLKTYNFKATFFITGNNLHKGAIDVTAPYPAMIRRMIAEGHQVASHTWSHYSLSNIPSDLRKQQMVKNERAIANIIGKYPTYMRPPYSQCNQTSGCWADMKALGYHRVYFDLDTQDYLNPTTIQNSKDIVQQILGSSSSNDYLAIQHDLVEQSVSSLSPFFFDLIKKKGWRGVTAGECLGDAPANWYRTPRGALPSTPSTSNTSITPSQSSNTLSTSSTLVSQASSQSTSTTPTSTSTRISTSTPATTVTSLFQTTSTSKTSAVASPTPAVGCYVRAGNFCGTIRPFSTRQGCAISAADCYMQSFSCSKLAGKGHTNDCNHYRNQCQKLTSYCAKCKNSCSNNGFTQ